MPFHQAPFRITTIGRSTLRFSLQALHFEDWAQRECLAQRRKAPGRISTVRTRSNRINNGSGIVERSQSTEVGLRIAPLYTIQKKTLWWHGTAWLYRRFGWVNQLEKDHPILCALIASVVSLNSLAVFVCSKQLPTKLLNNETIKWH